MTKREINVGAIVTLATQSPQYTVTEVRGDQVTAIRWDGSVFKALTLDSRAFCLVRTSLTYAVRLLLAGRTGIKVIKEIKSITGYGLKEAKELVDTVPSVVKDGLSLEEAQTIQDRLTAQGAKVEITGCVLLLTSPR